MTAIEHYARGFCGGCGEPWPCPAHKHRMAEQSPTATDRLEPSSPLPDAKGQEPA